MLLHRDEYLPDAFAAAEEELRKRNRPHKSMEEIAAAAAQFREVAAQNAITERRKRRLGKFAFHFYLWLAIPLYFLLKQLISMLTPP